MGSGACWGKQFKELGSKVWHIYATRRAIPMPDKAHSTSLWPLPPSSDALCGVLIHADINSGVFQCVLQDGALYNFYESGP